jgi:hypothetical protein
LALGAHRRDGRCQSWRPCTRAWSARCVPEWSVRLRVCAKPTAGQRLARWMGDRTEQLCPVLSPSAYQLPAARNWSTTFCGMRPRGETLILFALAQARTA